MGKKVYAIKEGFDSKNNKKIENIIVNTWTECLSFVKGVKGAKYKSFEDFNEAKKFLNDGEKLFKKHENKYPLDCMHIYVDGSYNTATEEYSYGMVAMRDNVVLHIESGANKNKDSKNIRQIAGELEGAIKGVEYALSKGEKRVVIFHDYAGICYHATGFWERREESSKTYYMKMNELMNCGIEVIFVKVDSHTGDLFNELADEKCKEKLGIDSDKTVSKWLSKNTIEVANYEVKEEIIKIAPGKEDNIIVVEDILTNKKNTKNECIECLDKVNKKDYIEDRMDRNKERNEDSSTQVSFNIDNSQDIIDKECTISSINNILKSLSLEELLKVLNYSKKLVKKSDKK